MMYVNSDFETALSSIAATVPPFDGDVKVRGSVLAYRFLIQQLVLNLNNDETVRKQAVIAADGNVDVGVILSLGLRLPHEKVAPLAAKLEKRLLALGLIVSVKKSGVILNTRGLLLPAKKPVEDEVGTNKRPDAKAPERAYAKLCDVYKRMTFDEFLPGLRIGHVVFGLDYKPYALLFKDFYAGDILDRDFTDDELVAMYKGIILGEVSPEGDATSSQPPEGE